MKIFRSPKYFSIRSYSVNAVTKILLSSRLETGSSMNIWRCCLSAQPSTSIIARKKHQTNTRSSPREIFIARTSRDCLSTGKNEIDSIPFSASAWHDEAEVEARSVRFQLRVDVEFVQIGV